ncbi:MAG: hypothetical protein QY326_01160 [Bdellovibrionota bacterium]|nr:MAG: hypothetical protein QY326_01160 [Bdellovibrionota bacterium]
MNVEYEVERAADTLTPEGPRKLEAHARAALDKSQATPESASWIQI